MPKLVWDTVGSRYYEAGVDRGVLYVDSDPGVAWMGLISVEETPNGGEAQPYYIDGFKYQNTSSPEEFQATLTAFTYPDAFAACDGTAQPRAGLFLMHQRRKSFGLAYRTLIGNDLTPDAAYKIHMVYNALAAPSQRSNTTVGDSADTTNFSWALTTRPLAMDEYRPTAHIVVDTRYTDPEAVSTIEDILYGTDADAARLPTFAELLAAFDTVTELTVTDNGDGTFTVTAPYDVIRMLDSETFEITAESAVFIDDTSYTISSE